MTEYGTRTTWYFLCKGKRRLTKGKDDAKLEKYLAEYYDLVAKYRAEASSLLWSAAGMEMWMCR